MSTSAEQQVPDGPTGLPTDEHDVPPLGGTESAPDGEEQPRRGEDAMPGIPTGGEPPTSG